MKKQEKNVYKIITIFYSWGINEKTKITIKTNMFFKSCYTEYDPKYKKKQATNEEHAHYNTISSKAVKRKSKK